MSGRDGILLMRWDTIYCTMGISYYLQKKARRRQEREADEFAAYFLMPDEELQKMKGLSIEDLA